MYRSTWFEALWQTVIGAAIILAIVGLVLSNSPAHATQCETWRASWYGAETCRPDRPCLTANGERFEPRGLTAAHRSLPFGTKLKVTYGDRTVTVRINDRGPFIAGRDLDLSFGAARHIGMVEAGVATVCVERV